VTDLEQLTVKGAAAQLQRSERSVRRYLHEGRLEAERVDIPAGGWRWLITPASVDALSKELQRPASRAGIAGVDELTAEVQALRGVVEAQSEQIAALQRSIQGLLPPATVETPKKRPWYKRLWQSRKGGQDNGEDHKREE